MGTAGTIAAANDAIIAQLGALTCIGADAFGQQLVKYFPCQRSESHALGTAD